MGFHDNPIVFLSKKLWRFSEGNRKNVITYVILFLFANAVNFFSPFIVGSLLNTIQTEGINEASLRKILSITTLFVALSVAFWAFHGPARVIETKNAFHVRSNYKKYLLEGTMDLPASWHSDHHSGDTIDKIEKGTFALYRFSGTSYEVIESIIRLVSSYLALTYFNLHAGYIVLFMIIITITLILEFDKRLIPMYQNLNHQENKISAKVFDIISNINTVIILRVQKLVMSSIMKKILAPFQLFSRNTKLNEIKWFIVSFCNSLMTTIVLASFIFLNYKSGNEVLIGTVYMLYEYLNRIGGVFFRFAYTYGEIVKQKTAVINAQEVSDEFREKKISSSSIEHNEWKEIRIESLGFSYTKEGEKEQHLDDVTISIKNGERIALIGESGSGKTTLLKILRELYSPQSVTIYVDDKKLAGDFSQISPHITLIPQDPEIFSTTILENITLGLEYDLEYVKQFTDMANFTSVVNQLPNKFESFIHERGVNLSGGEKQRLALARGLLASADKKIILLDEPTSSVDTRNEQEIYKHIFDKFHDKTLISSIHKLHLLPLFDKIYYFRRGKIIASGSFEQMMKQPVFSKVWKKYNSITTNRKKDEKEQF